MERRRRRAHESIRPASRSVGASARIAALAFSVAVALAIAGCAGSSGTSAPPPPNAVAYVLPSASPAASGMPGDPILIGAGDIAKCDSVDDEATAALLTAMPGIVFTLGDNAYQDGSAAQLRDCYGPSWGRLLDRTQFAVTGNHDLRTDGGAPARAYFGSAMTRDGVTWYSQDVGTWHVVVLDANCDQLAGGCGVDSPQVRWLRQDLAQSTRQCTLALWHQPRFSSGVHGNDAAVAPFWDALYAAGAELVLNGHDHDYERFAPQDPSGLADPARGITEIVAGTGGAQLREFKVPVANSTARSDTAHGVIELILHPGGWESRFVSTDGSFTDTAQGTCH